MLIINKKNMTDNKKTIHLYLNKKLEQIFKKFEFSSEMHQKQDLVRLGLEVLEKSISRPMDISKNEFMALVDSHNGTVMSQEYFESGGDALTWNLLDFHNLTENLEEKWKINIKDLAIKLKGFDSVDAQILYLQIKIYWENVTLQKDPNICSIYV